jgi:3D (Asp-Asp-Asp) domain-containing protein
MNDVSDIRGLKAELGLKAEPVASGRTETVIRPNADAIADAIAELAARTAPDEAPEVSPLRRIGFAVVLGLAACATASAPDPAPASPIAGPVLTPYERAMGFVLEPPPEEAQGPNLRLWATHYHTPEVKPAPETVSAAFPLLGRSGQPISPPLSHRDWCEAALQGSVSVSQGGVAKAYVFVDANGPEQANCDQWLGSLSEGVRNATRRARFMAVNHPLGCGVRNHPLMPFRTIAVDPAVIPLESVVFVPELRGRLFAYQGRDYVHDGYLFAGDRGGAIRGRHIDVFLVEAAAGPLEDLFASTENRTFAAHIVDADDARAGAIRETQAGRCGDASPG